MCFFGAHVRSGSHSSPLVQRGQGTLNSNVEVFFCPTPERMLAYEFLVFIFLLSHLAVLAEVE